MPAWRVTDQWGKEFLLFPQRSFWIFAKAIMIFFTIALSVLPARADPFVKDRAINTLANLVRASKALELGDQVSAGNLLTSMSSSLFDLQMAATKAAEQAREMGKVCQSRSISVLDEIEQLYQKQQILNTQKIETETGLKAVQVKLIYIGGELSTIDAKKNVIAEEARFRRKCANDAWYYMTTGRCWELGFKDVFENRVTHINIQAQDLFNDQIKYRAEKQDLMRGQSKLIREIEKLNRQHERLVAKRGRLHKLNKAMRRNVTDLSDISLFWSAARRVMEKKAGDKLDVLQEALLMLDDDRTGPAFDDYDREDIRSLRQTIVEFSKNLDSGGGKLFFQNVSC